MESVYGSRHVTANVGRRRRAAPQRGGGVDGVFGVSIYLTLTVTVELEGDVAVWGAPAR